MRFLKFTNIFLLSFLAFAFYSCEDNSVSNIVLNKDVSFLSLSERDSLIPAITTKGDLAKIPVTWTSSNDQIATVKNGAIKALSSGSCLIKAEAGGKSVTCQIYVSDKLTPVFYVGYLVYFGDYYKTGSTNLMNVILLNSTDTMALEFNTDILQKNAITTKVYDFINTSSTPNTLREAYVDTTGYYAMGSWIFSKSKDIRYKSCYHPLVDGTVNLSSKDSIYDIAFDTYDAYGNSIKGNFKGKLNYIDATIKKTKKFQQVNDVKKRKNDEIISFVLQKIKH